MKTTVWYLLVICLIKVKEMVNYIFAKFPVTIQMGRSLLLIWGGSQRALVIMVWSGATGQQLMILQLPAAPQTLPSISTLFHIHISTWHAADNSTLGSIKEGKSVGWMQTLRWMGGNSPPQMSKSGTERVLRKWLKKHFRVAESGFSGDFSQVTNIDFDDLPVFPIY